MAGTMIPYYGGKVHLADRIISLLPPHESYIEPFGGGAAVLLSKPMSPVEVYNDLDGRVFNLFRAIRDYGEELAWRLSWTPYSRREYEECLLESDQEFVIPDAHDARTIIEEARRYLYQLASTFGGHPRPTSGRWTYNRTRKTPTKTLLWQQRARDLLLISSRLRFVQIECDDALSVIARYDAPEAVFYIDPPYVQETRVDPWCYHQEMSIEKHQELVECLLSLRGAALVSGYDHPIYQPLEKAGWTRVCWKVTSLVAGTGNARLESVWVSPSARDRHRPRLL